MADTTWGEKATHLTLLIIVQLSFWIFERNFICMLRV